MWWPGLYLIIEAAAGKLIIFHKREKCQVNSRSERTKMVTFQRAYARMKVVNSHQLLMEGVINKI